MTRIFVDAKEVPSPPPGLTTLADVLKHVEQNYLGPRSVVRRVCVDGAPLVIDELASGVSSGMARVTFRESIEITTGTLTEVAGESIAEAIAYLRRIEPAVADLAAGFRDMPGPAEFDNLRQLYEGLYWLNLLLDRLQTSFGVDLGPAVSSASVRESHRRFTAILKRLIGAQEGEDYSQIAGILESEILPLVPIWKSLFEDAGRRVRTAQ
jgi:hypothetical protein